MIETNDLLFLRKLQFTRNSSVRVKRKKVRFGLRSVMVLNVHYKVKVQYSLCLIFIFWSCFSFSCFQTWRLGLYCWYF